MNKTEFIAAVAGKAELSKADAAKFLASFFEVLKEAALKDEKVVLVGLGTFSVAERQGRKGINPLTKKPMEIPASRSIKFKPGSSLELPAPKAKK